MTADGSTLVRRESLPRDVRESAADSYTAAGGLPAAENGGAERGGA
ncbi:MAG: hypothetical protein IKR85_05715 [Clostridia bacterium]|nr:hypothetical protein [Clostridia bacterium]